MLREIERTAVEACETGGAYLREQFRDSPGRAEYRNHDVNSPADVESERRILDVIDSSFPDHEVYAEESGTHDGSGRYRWIVDPLDGTNNFTSGLPSFATHVAVRDGDDAVVAVTYVPLLDDRYVAVRNDGVRYNGSSVPS